MDETAPPTPSRPPEDLSGERVLRNVPKAPYAGAERPVLGQIVLLSKLGQGGAGVVYHGVHRTLGTEVAVKVLPLAVSDAHDTAIRRFQREAQIAARLRSDHLVAVHDLNEDAQSGLHSIVMEYVAGPSAEDWKRALPGGRARETDALDVAIAATKGLAAAHVAGIVHRDVKPSNILLPLRADASPDPAAAKLSDLGLARVEAGGEGVTTTHMAMGTPGYLAPEQARDAKNAKKPADVFSMGATLYALLAGDAPFTGTSPTDAILKALNGQYEPLPGVRPDVSRPTADLVATCLRTDPAERFPDAPALLEALEAARAAVGRSPDSEADAVSLVRRAKERSEQGVAVATPPPSQTRIPDPERPATEVRVHVRLGKVAAVVAFIALFGWGMWKLLVTQTDGPGSLYARGREALRRAPLADLARWDDADSAKRRELAEWVAEMLPAFRFERLERFSADGVSHEVALFTHVPTGLEFSLVPGGRFVMGSPPDEHGRGDDETAHTVVLTRPFLIARREIAILPWRTAMQPSEAGKDPNPDDAGWVSWDDAAQFAVETDLEIPTEAQWEFACRAGTTTAFSTGAAAASLAGAANLADRSLRAGAAKLGVDASKVVFEDFDDGFAEIAPVGGRTPNAFGLFDVHGNVREWVFDSYAPYSAAEVTDPEGPRSNGLHVARGGSWFDGVDGARSAKRHRFALPMDSRWGFRPSKTVSLD